jgi:hypothetical protein
MWLKMRIELKNALKSEERREGKEESSSRTWGVHLIRYLYFYSLLILEICKNGHVQMSHLLQNKTNCKQEVGIWLVKKRYPQYGVPIWSLWPNIRFLPSIVAEKNATKNGHIQNVCSMCIKINKTSQIPTSCLQFILFWLFSVMLWVCCWLQTQHDCNRPSEVN